MDLMTTMESSTRWKWTGAAGKGSCCFSRLFLASPEPEKKDQGFQVCRNSDKLGEMVGQIGYVL